jgi:hypothetical protein
VDKKIFRLVHETARKNAARACLSAPDGYLVEVKEPTRNLQQNALMWALLADLSKQTDWHGVKLSEEEWKDLLSAGLVKSKVVPNIEGNGFVILGQRTSKMTKKQFAELVELIFAFGAERGVRWSDEARAA